MKIIKYLWNWIYQNVISMGKCYRIPWFSLDHFKEKNGLLQKIVKDFPEEVWYNFWNIWKQVDVNIVRDMLDKLEIVVLEKFDIYTKITWVHFDVEKKITWFDNYKNQILSLFDDLTAEENYFSYFLPWNLTWIANNYRIFPDYAPYMAQYMEFLNEIETQILWPFKETHLQLDYQHPPIFPKQINKESVDKYFMKYINSTDKAMLDGLVKNLYYKFLNEEVNQEMQWLKAYGEEKKVSDDDLKKNILKLLQWFTNYETLWENIYWEDEYKPVSRGGYFFYSSSSVFLKLADLTFIWGSTWGNIANFSMLPKIKEILKKKLKNKDITYYVMRIYTKKRKELWEYKDHKFDEKYIYLTNWTKVPINDDLYLFMKHQEKNENKWDYWFTLGLYGSNKEKLDEIYREIVKSLSSEGIQIQLNFHSQYDVFKDYNNWLSIWWPSQKACNVWNFLPLLNVARILPKTFPLRMESYFGIDTLSETPVFLNPFKDIDENKNMIVVGSSGSGKTVFAQQFLNTLTTDKVFAIDPVNTFANLGKFPELWVKVYNMIDLEYNPIAIDKQFYKDIWYPLNLVINDKVDLLIDILNLNKTEENEMNWKDFVKIVLLYFFEKQDIVKLQDISWFFRQIITRSKYTELDKEFLAYLDSKNILLNDDSFKIYKDKITALNFTVNTVMNTIIGQAMVNNDKDIIPDLFKERFVIFDIAWLWLTDKTIDQISEYDMALFLFLLYSLSLYTNFYKYLFEKKAKVYDSDLDKLVNNYIVIDEAHILLNDKRLLQKLDKDIRTVRNRRTSIVMLTQSIEDITKMGKEILENINIKMFFKKDDINSYKNLLLWKIDESSWTLPDYVVNTLLYIDYFIDLLNNNWKWWEKKRYVFLEYAGNYMVNEIKLTSKMLEIIKKKK